jgi:transitional endoplasmic reticulum ATPase
MIDMGIYTTCNITVVVKQHRVSLIDHFIRPCEVTANRYIRELGRSCTKMLFLRLIVALSLLSLVLSNSSGGKKSVKKLSKKDKEGSSASFGTNEVESKPKKYDYMAKTKDDKVIQEEAIMQRKRHANSFDCVEKDVGADVGIVTISSFKADELDLEDGEIVRLKGKRHKQTCGILKLDDNLSNKSVKTSKSIRSNLRVIEGEMIDIEPASKAEIELDEEGNETEGSGGKAEVKVASKIEVLPYKDSIPDIENVDLFENHLKPYFLAPGITNRPVMMGDIFTTPNDGEFQVIDIVLETKDDKKGKGKGDKIAEMKKQKKSKEDSEDDLLEDGVIALVGSDTEIIYDGPPIERSEDSRLNEVGYDDIGGCRGQLASIRELVELPLRHPEVFNSIGIPPPRGVLLHGPSGTGKTSLARAVAAETGAYFFVLNGPDIMSKQSGESEGRLRKAFEDAERNSPAIIFIDEIDAIAPKRDKAGGETEKRVVSQLLTLFDGIKRSANVVVIAATNRPNEIDTALRRFGRFDRELHIAQPDEEGRLEILRIKTKNMQLAEDCDLSIVAKNTHGYVGADLSQVCMEAAFRAIREVLPFFDIDQDPESVDPRIFKAIKIGNEHFDQAVDATNPSSLRENIAEIPNTSWADIGGLEDVKQELRELVQLPVEYGHLYEKFGTASSKGVLFYGPPGCGKTLLAKAIANEAGANFISIKGPELLDAHIGESEANVRALFDKARAASPCILFFDEMDSIAKARSGGGSGGGSGLGDNVINTILTEIDSVEQKKSVFIIGATNRPDILDSSVTRPGHLDQLVYIPLPDYESRLSIFHANLRKCPVAPDVDVKKLAKNTEGFSGADITEICQRAAKNAIREDIEADVNRASNEAQLDLNAEEGLKRFPGVKWIRREHFVEATNRARRSVSDEDVVRYKQFLTKQADDAKDAGGFSFAKGDKEEEEEDDDNLYG